MVDQIEIEVPELDVSAEESPAVAAVLATGPEKPGELVRAARVLARLQRPDLARTMLRAVLDAGLNEDQLADLCEQFGSDVFVTMANQESLAPEGRELSKSVMSAATRRFHSPERLKQAIVKLSDPSAATLVSCTAQLYGGRYQSQSMPTAITD